MKKIFSIIFSGILLLSATSCVTEKTPLIEDVNFNRCLVPTNVTTKIVNGDQVVFNWDKGKTATEYTLEIYYEEITGDPIKTLLIKKDEVPYTVQLEADMEYAFRVKASNIEKGLEDSKWFVGEKKIQTIAIKSKLDPAVVERYTETIDLKWKADPEVDHIRITPALDGKSEYSRQDLTESEISSGSATVKGLAPSTFYVLTVHFKSADRGAVYAWTRPSVSDDFVKVTDALQLKTALESGFDKISVAYSEETYDIGDANITGDFTLLGQSTADGKKPVIGAAFVQTEGLKSIRFEDVSFVGTATENHPQLGHVFTTSKANTTLSKVEYINVEITDYQKGIYYDNNGVSVTDGILMDNIQSSYIAGSGGDNFDIRQVCTIASITVQNSTFNHGTRTVFRFDKNVNVSGAVTIKNCTFNKLCSDNGNVINGSNVQGILAIKAACAEILITNNLFLNQEAWLVGSNKDVKLPKFVKNYTYNCVSQFYDSSKLDGTGARADMSEAVVLAEGGVKLEKDPCVDSEGEKFNVTNEQVIENNIGDPRWYEAYIDQPEDLTLNVTAPVKTWDLFNTKTFYKHADKDMVRDNIRFYVKNSPIVFGKAGFDFPGIAQLENGVPVDGGIGFKVNRAGSVVVSTASNSSDASLVTISLDGKPVIGVPDNTNNYQYTFPDFVEGEEHMIYIYGAAPFTLTFLQWNDNTDVDGPKVLDTPVITLDKTTIVRGSGDVTVSWDEIKKAGAYEVTVNGKTQKVTETSFTIATATLKDWKYLVSVKAVPADDDTVRQPSEEAVTSFTITETGINMLQGEKVWDAEFFEKMIFTYHTDEKGQPVEAVAIPGTVYNGDLAFCSNAKTKFQKVNEIPCVQTGGKVTYGNKACLQFKVKGSGTLTVKYTSTSPTDAGVYLKVANGDTPITETDYLAPVKGAEPAVTDIKVDAKEGDLINIGASANMYFYEIKWTPGGAVEKTETWDFSSDEWKTKLSSYAAGTDYNDWDFAVNGLRVVSNGKSMKYNTSSDVYFIQPGGKSDGTNRYLEFTAPASGKLTVWATNTGSSEDLTRMVTIKPEGQDEVSLPGGYTSAAPPVAVPFDITVSAPTSVKIYPTGNGLRFYKVEYTYTSEEPVKEDHVWDFSTTDWQDKLSVMGDPGVDITKTWDITVDGLNYYATKSRWNTTFIQVTQGDIENGVFTFTAKGPGYVYVNATNTGSSDADRNVCVQEGSDTGTLQKQKGGVPSNGEHAVPEFKVNGGQIKVFTDAALRIYSIEFHTDKK